MAGFKKRSFRKKSSTRKRRSVRGGRKSSAVSFAVKKYVKRTIHSQIENKCVQINPGPLSFGNVLESPEFNAFPMAPLNLFWSISQGVGQGARVGNVIKVRKTYLNYILYPTQYDVTTNPLPAPQEVRMMLGYVKNTPTFAPLSGDIAQLFQAGSSSAAPIGNLKDLISVYNTDYWTIKKSWTHKVGHSNYAGLGTSTANQQGANNDFKLNVMKRMDITSMCPKTCIFNDSSVTTNTKNLFFMYYAVASNGFTLTATNLPIRIDYWIDFHYEDA